jgi:ubiquinol-cytochrome c reductase iron-sulfur subunit
MPGTSPSRNVQATDQNRTLVGHEEWLALVGLCTREGCVLQGNRAGDIRGDYGGWFCPCCASHFDTAGRVRKALAPTNLAVPQYTFMSKSGIAFLSVRDIDLRDPDSMPGPQAL